MDLSRPDPSLSSRVEALLDQHARAGHWPGAAWAVGRPGEPEPRRAGAVGRLAVEPRSEAARVDALYDLASLTKPLALGATVLALAADGQLDPDEPLDAELPELVPGAGDAPSLADLLAHRAGFPDWSPLYRLATSPEEVPAALARLAGRGRRAEACYSCLGPIAAGIALERRLGHDLRELFAREVAGPLGLEEGDACWGRVATEDRPRAAPTERGRRREAELADEKAAPRPGSETIVPGPDRVLRGEVHDGNATFLGGAAGNAGLFATARAVFAIASAMAAGRRPFDRLAARLVAEPAARSGDDVRTFAFQSGEAPSAPAGPLGTRSFGHVGFTGTSVWIAPEHGLIAVLLTNRVHPQWTEAPVGSWRRSFHQAALELGRELG